MAETHDFGIALSSGSKVATALTTTHRQCGECVLECLFEAQELQDTQIYRGMETQTALVRANGTVELHTIANVHLNLALVVDPGNAERGDALWLHDTLHNLSLLKFGVLIVHVFD